jgi:hypothetical protein
MATKNFNELPEVTVLVGDDSIPVWKGKAAKVTLENLAASLSIPEPAPPLDMDALAAAVGIDLKLGGTPAQRSVSREIWIAVGTPGDDAIGDARNPFRVETSDQFDKLMRQQAANFLDASGKTLPLHAHFLPGNFLTRGEWHYTYGVGFPATYPGKPVYPNPDTELGWLVHDDWIIEGAGMGVTTVTLEKWPTYPGPSFQPSGIWPHAHSVISGARGNVGYASHRARVKNLTVNCNANAITQRPMGIKLDAVHLYGKDTRIENVGVKQSYGKNFTTQTGVSSAVGDPGVYTAPAHGMGPNEAVTLTKAITAVSVANPAVVTSVGHGRRTGEVITIAGVVNVTPNINASHTITVIDADKFQLNGVNVTATGAVGATAAWTSAVSFIQVIDADRFYLAGLTVTSAGSGLAMNWGGGQGESFPLSLWSVEAVGLAGYPNQATDVTGAIVQDCVVEDFAAGSNYEIAVTIAPGATGNGFALGNTVRRPPGVTNATNACGVTGIGSMVLHNRAENCGALAHYDSNRCSGILIAFNTAINCHVAAVSLTPAFAGAVYDNITISNNYFVVDTITEFPHAWGLSVNFAGVAGTSFNNLIIRDNVFRHNGHTAVGAYALGLVIQNIDGLTIEGNTIESTFDQTITGNTNMIIRNNHTETGGIPEGLADTGNAASYLVSTLPASPQRGDTAIVTDATAPTYLSPLVGGGAVVARALYNGTTWVAG